MSLHPVYNAWREQRIANGQSTEPIFWAQETGCYPTMGNYASNGNIVVAQWGGQNDYIAPNDIQEALAIYEASLVSGATSGATSGKKPSISKRPRRTKMKSVTGRDDCGFLRQSGGYTDAFEGGGLDGLLDYLGAEDIYEQAFTIGGSSSLLDALANQPMIIEEEPPVMSGGGDGMPPPVAFEEEPPLILDPNPVYITGCTDYNANNFNPSADADDGSCVYTMGCTDELAANFNPSAIVDDGSCVFTGGPTPPPPVMSGGGDGMPPPVDFSDGSEITPVMSGGGDGMPPPPPAPIKKPVRRPKPSRIARTLSGLI